MKKMMAMLLASVMAAGTFTTTAFAYTGDDVQKNTPVSTAAQETDAAESTNAGKTDNIDSIEIDPDMQVLRVGNRSLRHLNDDCQLFRGQALGMYHFTDFAVFLLVVLSVPFLSALLPLIAFSAGFFTLRSNLFQFQTHVVSFPGE